LTPEGGQTAPTPIIITIIIIIFIIIFITIFISIFIICIVIIIIQLQSASAQSPRPAPVTHQTLQSHVHSRQHQNISSNPRQQDCVDSRRGTIAV
jgi:hypothetical protein